MRWIAAFPAWGDRCAGLAASMSIPSVLESAWCAGVKMDLRIYTDQMSRFSGVAGRPGAGLVSVLGFNALPAKYAMMTTTHQDALETAEDGDRVVLMCADMVMSRETIAACEARFAEGKRLIMSVSLSTLGDPPISAGSNELADWGFKNLHPYAEDRFWGGRGTPPSSVCFWKNYDVTARAFHLHPVATVRDRGISLKNTIDSDLVLNYQRDEIHVVTRPRDEFTVLESSPPDREYVKSAQPISAKTIVDWTRSAKLGPLHWWLADHRVILRGEGRTDDEKHWITVRRVREGLRV